VGEGIEHRVQLEQLQREKCDSGQGFLFARPLRPAAIEELLGGDGDGRSVAASA
jgi:EAL domain-containing protein (putative c-di-GMP-specific phosphodiesterase class I)